LLLLFAAVVIDLCLPLLRIYYASRSHIFDLLVAADRSPRCFEHASCCIGLQEILGFVSHQLLAKRFCSLAGASEVFDICCSYLLLLLLLLGFSCNV
jgi:hypothetical protein